MGQWSENRGVQIQRRNGVAMTIPAAVQVIAFVEEVHDEGPDKVELLLHGERPENTEGRRVGDTEGFDDVHEEEIEIPVARPGDAEQERCYKEQKKIRGEDAACAARVKVPEVFSEALVLVFEEDAGDQEAREDEEEVNAHPEELDLEEVMEKDRRDRDGSNAVQLINSFCH